MPANGRVANGQRTQTAPVWVRNDEMTPDGQCRHFATLPGGTARCWRSEEHEEAGKPHEPGLGLVPPMVAAMEETIAQMREEGTWEQTDGPQVNGRHPEWAIELETWWVQTAAEDIGDSMAKIVDYGGRGAAYDLIATGHDLAAMNGRRVQDDEAAELAVLFYLSSKVNRLLAAAIDGRRGSDDTALDITYYSMMLRRIRAVGGWPVKPA
jgi:hypothetical protein